MKSYETYIFDLDGTITNTMTVWLEILREVLLLFAITLQTDRELLQYSHDLSQLTNVGLLESDMGKFKEAIYAAANRRLPEADFHTGAYQMLETLKKQGKRIAIFSSMDRPMFEPAIKKRRLNEIVEVTIAGTDVPSRKPHPAGIFKALEDLHIAPEFYNQAVYIGDKDTDIQTAHNAGIASILYYPASHHLFYDLAELKKHNPTHIITEWQELVG
jgi:phosphoglycolate phosphatase